MLANLAIRHAQGELARANLTAHSDWPLQPIHWLPHPPKIGLLMQRRNSERACQRRIGAQTIDRAYLIGGFPDGQHVSAHEWNCADGREPVP